jgi:purine-binding chemotaxis protein CheW
MAAKKKSANAGKRKDPTKKITLPAFGLAEEILGTRGAEFGVQSPEPTLPVRAVERREIERIPDTVPEVVPESELHLVTFHLESEEYGVDIGRVQEIIRVGHITGVPNAPEFIRGVINLRGKIIPVIDLRKRMVLPDTPLTKLSRIMVVEAGPKVLGLLVDRVSQVIRVPLTAVDAAPDELGESRGFVRGIGKIESRLIMIMELDRVLAKDVWLAEQHD